MRIKLLIAVLSLAAAFALVALVPAALAQTTPQAAAEKPAAPMKPRAARTEEQTGGKTRRLKMTASALRPRGSKPSFSRRKAATATCQPELPTTACAASSRCRRAASISQRRGRELTTREALASIRDV
jgi:hypothetical protein